MRALARSSTVIAATGLVVATLAASPPASAPPLQSHDIQLTAATPPGGLITSFLGNQLLYCSLICTSAVQGAVTVTGVALQTPATFLVALQSGDLLKAVGVTAASVTGPAEAAAAGVIFKDGMEVAPRALNAFEVGVVGLLNVVPAAAGGLPGVVTALETARDDTFTALNLPVAPNPTPTVMAHGVLQVAVIGAINVGAAVIFPALNDVLLGAFQVPDAVARTLALTGDPVKAVGAGVAVATTVVHDAGTVIARAVDTAVTSVRAASDQSVPTTEHAVSPKAQKTALSVTKNATAHPHRQHVSTAKHPGH
ncbi:hypothetical protein [Mycolicibacterium komossense]|uniref:PE-PGRS family protein n=1 Tax=Mycolicibacterium komossense TaxID=1779 RepID=A0ABT3CIU0_9MYCO|nr:hypothetical protein [Mycolicibacterium komossense]MCV7229375.1 hypothetical protein [Mycolicibacterium komossense]